MKTESKLYPKILRSNRENMIFFPDNIHKIQKEDMEGELEELYEYDLIKVLDKGQQIKNYELCKQENYAELRKIAYGSWHDQLELMQEKGFDMWRESCQKVKESYPKETIKPEEEEQDVQK